MVSFVGLGLGEVIKRAKFREIDVDGATFTLLRRFRGYFKEGSWGFWRGDI